MEDVVNRGHVRQETGLKRLVSLKGLKACRELQVGQVSAQYGGPTAKLVVNQDVRAAWLAKKAKGLRSCHLGLRRWVLSNWDAGHN